MILPGIYANTLLVTLNNRATARLNSVQTSSLCSKAPLTRNFTAPATSCTTCTAKSFHKQEEREPGIVEVPIEIQDRNSVENQWRENMDTEDNSDTEVEERRAEHV